MPIYSIRKIDTVKICIQGGIIAANGLTDIYIIHSISATSHTRQVTRDSHNPPGGYTDNRQPSLSFSKVLENELNESASAPQNCHTITYGNDCRLHTFLYQRREYSY